MLLLLRPVWAYRSFVLSAISSDIRARFVGSRLGGLWALVHPLVEVAMYAIVLSAIMSSRLSGIDNRFSYAIYLMAGLSFWTLFSDLVNRGLNVFLVHAPLLKKVAFPVATLPLVVGGTALVNNLLLIGMVLLAYLLMGHGWSWALLVLPVLLALTVVLGLGLGFLLGILNVFVRDVGQIVPIALQLCFWFTPIVYPLQAIPLRFRGWFEINPLFHMVQGYHDVLAFQKLPSWGWLVMVAGVGVVLVILAAALYRRARPELVDML
jgi:lipopolysaccharide transport system permease protein